MTTAVILAGGGGKRLWPLSTQKLPKFLLKIGEKSLLANTIERLQRSELFNNIVVISGEKFKESVDKDIKNYSNVWGLFEPSARDSLPAIILANEFVRTKLNDNNSAFFPADHIIENEEPFFKTLKTAIDSISSDNLVTIGIKPTFPSNAFGYIQYDASSSNGDVKLVEKFIEKPETRKAEMLIEQGNTLWNSGLFLAQTKFISNTYTKIAKNPNSLFKSEKIQVDVWETLEKTSFDYGFVEKLSNDKTLGKIMVTKSDFSWVDIGDFNTLEAYLRSKNLYDENKNNFIEVDSNNNFIYNETDELIALAGVQDTIVIKTNKATMISKKDDSQAIKQIVLELEKRDCKEYL